MNDEKSGILRAIADNVRDALGLGSAEGAEPKAPAKPTPPAKPKESADGPGAPASAATPKTPPDDPGRAALLSGGCRMRYVDCGSCGGCELEIAALAGPDYDMQRFGLEMVASPRHADLFLVTGSLTRNMAEALEITVEAASRPRYVVAVGDCASGDGPFSDSPATLGSVSAKVHVDLEIRGCPPPPEAILGALRAYMSGSNG